MRLLLWILAGVLLGVIIHVGVILAVPRVAANTLWSRISAVAPENKVVVLAPVSTAATNPLQLDPSLSYAICRVDLSKGPAVINGTLPDAFWSLAIFDPSGSVIYSTTNRDGIGQNLNLGIFNADQTHLLAEQQIDVADGLLIVEASNDHVFVVIRLAPPFEAVRKRDQAALSQIVCGTIDSK